MSTALPQAAAPEPVEAADTLAQERRRSGRRARDRDRLMDRATRPYAAPPYAGADARTSDLENLLIFVDDDLRETALALHHIEAYLVQTLGLLEHRRLDRENVRALATDPRVLQHLDLLNETVESLRRRLAKLASKLK